MGLLVVSLLVTVLVTRPALCEQRDEAQCPSNIAPSVKFAVTSLRNTSGHWITEVDFQHGGQRTSDRDRKDTPPWLVGIEQSSVACGGVESNVHFKISFTSPPPVAGPGYELFPQMGYYKFHPVITNWPSARRTCAEEGAHLVIINSEREADIVKTLFARFPKIKGPSTDNWAWIGVSENGVNGQYFTIFGDSVETTGYIRWVPTQPNNIEHNDCLVVQRTLGAFEDVPCASGYPFICEQHLW